MNPTRGEPAQASVVAAQILERADSDVAFIPRLTGESLHILTEHFVRLIERGLSDHDVGYGDHPLLRPFVDLHSRELANYVLNGIALRHQFGIEAIERLKGDPAHLLRVDLWDSLNSFIEDAERRFLHEPDGLMALLAKVRGVEPDAHRRSSGTSRHEN